MKKLIKLDFDNTTRERKTEDSFSELYSYDKNNGSFEFEILNDTLTTEQVTALFKFTESNKIWKTTGTVEGNKVNVTFDTSLITQNETVICYLYFDEEQRTSDTFRFKFKVKVSEIDKMNRYEVKERFINNTVIVDRLDVVTKTELQEALKNVGGIATEGLLTETKAEETYAKKTDAVDNTNFELVKNRVLALELKTDKDTVYDDSEVKERLTTLENKAPVDLSGYATKEELRNVSGSQPLADNLVTKQELEEKQYLTTHQDLSEYAKKSELYNDSDLKARVEVLEQKTDKDTVYDDTPLKERVMALESRAIEGGTYDDKPIRDRLDVLEAKEDKDTKYDDTEVKNRLTELESKPVVDTSVFVTDEKLNSKGYLTEHQDLTPYALKSEIPQPYNDTPLNERITALENKPTTGGSVDTSNFVTKEELKEKEDNIFEVINRDPLYKVYEENTITEHLKGEEGYGVGNVDGRGGTIYSNASRTSADIFKGDINKEKFVDFQTAMFTVANSIPDDYHLYDLMYAGGEDRKVLFLSNKNFSEVVPKEELKAIIREVGGTESAGSNIDTSNLATKEELAKAVTKEELETKHYVTEEELNNKAYLTQHQPLDNLVTKEELNNKRYVTDEELNSKGYLTEHQNISHLVTNDELNSKGYLTEEVLNSKNYLTEDVLNTKNYLTQHQDLSSLVTKQELENKHYLTEHQPLTHLATTSDLEVLRNIAVSKSELSSKVDNTEFNTFKDNVVTKTELSEKGYLTTHQDLSEYALKSELYNDTDLKNRVETLENRPNNDTAYDDTDLKRRVSELEQRSDNNIVYDDRDLRERVEALESKPEGATKEDVKGVTDRVLTLENKPSGGQTQDTGWLKVSGENAIAGNIVEIRRIGNTVHVRFRNENGDFIIDENLYFTLDKEITGGFGSVKNNLPIFLLKNNRELGRIIIIVSDNRISIESMIDGELSNSKVVYINEFSYITDEPFPTNLH